MSLIDTVKTTSVTVPTFLVDKPNGSLDLKWLRTLPGESTRLDFKMFVPVSYAMQALHVASKGIVDRTTGRYRTYERQVELFRSRYSPNVNAGFGYKIWEGRRWYLQRNPATGRAYAMAATPGRSNHGMGLADDVAEDNDSNPDVDSMSDTQLIWMRDNAPAFGFGLETRSERWHWHWIGRSALSQLVVDVLDAAGVTIEDLSAYGFTVPKPTGAPLPPVLPTPSGVPSIRPGATNATTVIPGVADDGRVSWLQAVLGVSQSGTYDLVSVSTVRTLQAVGGLLVDGIYGVQTEAKFREWRGV